MTLNLITSHHRLIELKTKSYGFKWGKHSNLLPSVCPISSVRLLHNRPNYEYLCGFKIGHNSPDGLIVVLFMTPRPHAKFTRYCHGSFIIPHVVAGKGSWTMASDARLVLLFVLYFTLICLEFLLLIWTTDLFYFRAMPNINLATLPQFLILMLFIFLLPSLRAHLHSVRQPCRIIIQETNLPRNKIEALVGRSRSRCLPAGRTHDSFDSDETQMRIGRGGSTTSMTEWKVNSQIFPFESADYYELASASNQFLVGFARATIRPRPEGRNGKSWPPQHTMSLLPSSEDNMGSSQGKSHLLFIFKPTGNNLNLEIFEQS